MRLTRKPFSCVFTLPYKVLNELAACIFLFFSSSASRNTKHATNIACVGSLGCRIPKRCSSRLMMSRAPKVFCVSATKLVQTAAPTYKGNISHLCIAARPPMALHEPATKTLRDANHHHMNVAKRKGPPRGASVATIPVRTIT